MGPAEQIASIGAPADGPAWVATALGLLGLLWFLRPSAFRRWLLYPSATHFAIASALTSATLSAAYIEVYLRGGPRIIDATAYYLQARTFASGQLALEVPEPVSSFIGRFLLPTADGRLAVLFPPGYAALLAVGFLAGAPLAIGPAIGAGISVLTYLLGRRLLQQEVAARLATVFSVLCATLRYHTADTMSHGLSALLLGACLLCATGQRKLSHVVGGLMLGWLVATRPVTGLGGALGVWLFLLAAGRQRCWTRLPLWSGALIGILLFLVQQWRATGEFLVPSQLRYYALADGPPGCFGLGLGKNIGCRVEHGDFVAAYLPNGYGVAEALATTARRLVMHLPDAGNLDVFLPLVAGAMWLGRRQANVRILASILVIHIVLYAGFYFDGNYPGGGARLFADVLPVEHLLLAGLFCRLRLEHLALSLMLLGFGVRQSHAQRKLAAREGGAPMFQPELLRKAGIERGIVFVDSDHGFNLGYTPGQALVVARYRGDANDHLIWQQLNTPNSYRYRYDPTTPNSNVTITAYTPSPSPRVQAQSLWPPFEVTGGWVKPEPLVGSCRPGASGLLAITTADSQAVSVRLRAWSATAGRFRLALGLHKKNGPRGGRLVAGVRLNGAAIAGKPAEDACGDWTSTQGTPLHRGPVSLELDLLDRVVLDHFELLPESTTRPD